MSAYDCGFCGTEHEPGQCPKVLGLPMNEHAKVTQRELYAAYANHCAIQKKVPMTWHSWKRKKGQWCHDLLGKRVENEERR